MTDNEIQIHAPGLNVNAHALDGAYAAWLADDAQWPEYKAARNAYCFALQKSFDNYQRAAWDAWSSLRRFRDPGRAARKAYLRRMVEEAAGRLDKINADDSLPPSVAIDAEAKLERAKFDLRVATFPLHR